MSNLVSIQAGQSAKAIVPHSFDEVQRMATMFLKSGLTCVKGVEGEQAIASMSMIIMQGLELGVSPIQAIQNIALINGKPCVYGDLIPALLWSHGHIIDEFMEGEGDDREAVCIVTRGDNGKVIKRTFSYKQAVKAGLTTRPGPWKLYTDRMLQMRARGFAARDGAADVLKGLAIKEEVEDIEREPRDVTPSRLTPPPPPAIEEFSQEESVFDQGEYISNIEAMLEKAKDIEAMEKIMEDHESLQLDDDTNTRVQEVYDLYESKLEKSAPAQLDIEEAIKEKVA